MAATLIHQALIKEWHGSEHEIVNEDFNVL